MKDVLQGVIRRIKADAAITAKVGTRVYRTIPTNPEHPFIACARIDGPHVLSGVEGWVAQEVVIIKLLSG